MSSIIGDIVFLNCIVFGNGFFGFIRWFRGFGLSREVIYNFEGFFYFNVIAVRVFNSDFSIFLYGVFIEYVGIYYCVKF